MLIGALPLCVYEREVKIPPKNKKEREVIVGPTLIRQTGGEDGPDVSCPDMIPNYYLLLLLLFIISIIIIIELIRYIEF